MVSGWKEHIKAAVQIGRMADDKHRQKCWVMTIDWSWLKCRPVGKGRFYEKLRGLFDLRAFRCVLGSLAQIQV